MLNHQILNTNRKGRKELTVIQPVRIAKIRNMGIRSWLFITTLNLIGLTHHLKSED